MRETWPQLIFTLLFQHKLLLIASGHQMPHFSCFRLPQLPPNQKRGTQMPQKFAKSKRAPLLFPSQSTPLHAAVPWRTPPISSLLCARSWPPRKYCPPSLWQNKGLSFPPSMPSQLDQFLLAAQTTRAFRAVSLHSRMLEASVRC
ncbi:hypothetical protein TRVL_04012 [Trypanosoma vivax]|nr:hypothetical protein TRVL_04012 [Trypanosoma vivax]